MRLFYYAGYKNFGDAMNPWFWEHFLPNLKSTGDDSIIFSGIGSVLNDRLPIGSQNIVFGSGAGYGDAPSPRNWKFYAVRGPRTAGAFGLTDIAFGDPAILLPRMLPVEKDSNPATIFVPHRESGALGGWKAPCAAAGIKYVDPQTDFVEVVRSIGRAKLVITESLHGAIVADAYRVPWIPVVVFHSHPFKWHDWTESLLTTYTPTFIDQETVKAFRSPALRVAWRAHWILAGRAARGGKGSGAARHATKAVATALGAGYLDRRPVFDRRVRDLEKVMASGVPNLSPEGRLGVLQEGLLRQIEVFKREWPAH